MAEIKRLEKCQEEVRVKHKIKSSLASANGFKRVYLGVRTCEVFLCFVTIMFVLSIVLTSLFSLFYVTREGNRFLTPRMSRLNEACHLISPCIRALLHQSRLLVI